MSSLRDRLKAKREKIADKSASFERPYKWSNGKTAFRLLPGKVAPDEFFEEIGIHWIKDQNGKVVTTVGDRQICFGEPCPVRESIEKLMQIARDKGDDAMLERGKDMLAKSRYFANIAVLKAPGEFDKNKAVLAEFPETVWDSMLSQLEDLLEDVSDDADYTKEGPLAYKDGVTFVLERSGSGKETRYNVYINPKTEAVKPEIMEGALDLSSYKRAQFEGRTNKAIAVLGAMIGLNPEEIARRLTAPDHEMKRLGATSTDKASKATETEVEDTPADDDDGLDLGDDTEADAAVPSEDDILSELDGL